MRWLKNKILGGCLLMGGTSIGAGMIALPITTGSGGFFGGIAVFTVTFLFMLANLFLWLEANMTISEIDSNMVTIARHRLGTFGEIVTWVTFLLLLYAACAAYMSGLGSLVAGVLDSNTSLQVTSDQGILGCAVVLAIGIYLGTAWVDGINRIAMLGLITTFIVMSLFISPYIHSDYLTHGKIYYLPAAVPVIITAFTSHMILPSLRLYCNDDLAQLKKILLIGSCLPLVVYIIWELMITGVIPLHGDNGLLALGQQNHPVAGLTHILRDGLGLAGIAAAVGAFSFFALLTSFLGVGLALTDFLSDGFGLRRTWLSKLVVELVAFGPPLLFALFYPSGFVLALSFAGVFIAILYGFLPFFMVWRRRYRDGIASDYQLPGGKPMLFVIFFGACLIILLQIAARLGWVPVLS
jgi:tyrosine-specific transport protein